MSATLTQHQENGPSTLTSPAFPEGVRAVQLLQQNPIPALRKLQVQEDELRIVISGRVATYYLKQMAQEALMPILGQRQLANQVVVTRE